MLAQIPMLQFSASPSRCLPPIFHSGRSSILAILPVSPLGATFCFSLLRGLLEPEFVLSLPESNGTSCSCFSVVAMVKVCDGDVTVGLWRVGLERMRVRHKYPGELLHLVLCQTDSATRADRCRETICGVWWAMDLAWLRSQRKCVRHRRPTLCLQ